MAHTNLQRRTRSAIERLIEEQRRSGDAKLPTETELTDRLRVGRNTLRTVIDELAHAGVVERIQGRGTFIVRTESRLRFSSWVPGEIPSRHAFERMVRTFEESAGACRVESVVYPYYQYTTRVIREMNAGDGLDVVQIAPYWLQRFHRSGFLRRLDDLISTGNLTRRYSKDIDSCRIGDELYALNWGLAPLVLYYNKRVLERAGLDPDDPPATLEDLYRASVHVNALGQEDLRGICLPLDSYEAYVMWLYPFLRAFGGGFSDSMGNTSINTDENAAALRWLRALNAHGGCGDPKTITDARILFATGHVAFIIDGPYGRGFYRTISGLGVDFDDQYGVTTVPVGPSGRSESVLLAHSLTISSRCADPEAAYAWIEHLTTHEENARRYFEASGMIPAIRDILHKPFFYKDPFASVLIRQIETATPAAFAHPSFSSVLPFTAVALSEAIIGARTVEDRLAFLDDVVRVSNRIGPA